MIFPQLGNSLPHADFVHYSVSRFSFFGAYSIKTFPAPLYKSLNDLSDFFRCREGKRIKEMEKRVLKFLIIELFINEKKIIYIRDRKTA